MGLDSRLGTGLLPVGPPDHPSCLMAKIRLDKLNKLSRLSMVLPRVPHLSAGQPPCTVLTISYPIWLPKIFADAEKREKGEKKRSRELNYETTILSLYDLLLLSHNSSLYETTCDTRSLLFGSMIYVCSHYFGTASRVSCSLKLNY
jgi:hypothetical protein